MGQFSQIGPDGTWKQYQLTVNVANAPQSLGRPYINLTSLTLGAPRLVTAVSAVAHNLLDGEMVTISGTTQPEYSGDWTVEVPDPVGSPTTFRYRINDYTTAPVSPATGATKLALPRSDFKRALIKNHVDNASASVTFGPTTDANFDDLSFMLEYLIEPPPPARGNLATWFMKSATVGTKVQVLWELAIVFLLSLFLMPATVQAQPYFPSTPYTRGFMTKTTAAEARTYLGIGAGFGTGNFDSTQFTTDWTGTNTTIKYQFITTNQMNLGGLYIGTNVAGHTAQVFIQNLTNSNVGLIVREAGGQAVTSFRVQDSAGNNRFSVSPTAISATQPIIETVGTYIGTNIGQASQVFIQNLTNTQPGLIVQGAGGQTAPYQRWTDSTGAIMAEVKTNGFMVATNGFIAPEQVSYSASSPGYKWSSGAGFIHRSGNDLSVYFSDAGNAVIGFYNGIVSVGDGYPVAWGPGQAGAVSPDVGITRNAAGLIEINNGTIGTWRDLKVRQYQADSTITTPGTTGNQTINKSAGRVNFAAAATTLTVTCSLCSANSIVMGTVASNDATATLKNIVPGAGSFTITLTAGATDETAFNFFIVNP